MRTDRKFTFLLEWEIPTTEISHEHENYTLGRWQQRTTPHTPTHVGGFVRIELFAYVFILLRGYPTMYLVGIVIGYIGKCCQK